MSRVLAPSLIVALAFLVTVSACATFRGPTLNGKPIVDALLRGDDFFPPSTLSGVLERSDALAHVRITQSVDRSRPDPRRYRTEHTIEVIEILRAHPNVTSGATVCQPLGTIEYPDRYLRHRPPGEYLLEVLHEYVVFLKWHATTGCLWPAVGPIGILHVDSRGRLDPVHDVGEMRALRGLTIADLRERLKRLPGNDEHARGIASTPGESRAARDAGEADAASSLTTSASPSRPSS